VIESVEKHLGSWNIVHLKDAAGSKFTTRQDNVFVIGKDGNHPLVSLPRQKGIRLSILQERERNLKKENQNSKKY
jgi:small subunit ribosomal protein S4e